jgi:hypothetical protein
LRALVATCDLDLVINLARRYSSLDELVGDQLAVTARLQSCKERRSRLARLASSS